MQGSRGRTPDGGGHKGNKAQAMLELQWFQENRPSELEMLGDMNHLHQEIMLMLTEQQEEMRAEDRQSWTSEDTHGSSKFQQVVRHKRYQGTWERNAFNLTPEYLDQVTPIIMRFLKGKPGCKTYARMQYWVDAGQVISEVNRLSLIHI